MNAALATLLVATSLGAQVTPLDAPNVVPISATLVTSGQPTRAALASLTRQGFDAVIYLAPSSVPDAVPEEAQLLSKQGIEFIHLPVPFDAPTEAHYRAFAAALDRLGTRRVLVHCQVNLRASTFVFLHRVLARKEDPNVAYADVTRVWVPEGPWKRLVVALLRAHDVKFDPM